MKTNKLKFNPNNPRKCSKDKLEKLMRSIESFPEMMKLRPMVYDPETMYVLGGNQRLAAIRKLGMKEIPDEWAIAATDLTPEQQKEFVLRDNVQLGDWKIGGLNADSGVTGRKLAIDNYGTRTPIGGGAFSGKDPTKVDRSAAYMARKIAVDILRQKNAKEVIVSLAYAIGVPDPVMTQCIADGNHVDISHYNLTPKAIIDALGLRNIDYEKTAAWGHFGIGMPWDA